MENHVPNSELEMPPLSIQRRRMVLLGVLAVLTISLLLALGDARSTLSALSHANWRLIGLALLIHYSGFAVRGHRWQILLRTSGHRLGYVYVTSILLGGWFVSALLPARLGEVFRIAALRLPVSEQRPAVPVSDGLSSIILERTLDIGAITILSAGFGYLALDAHLPSWVMASYGVALALLLILAAVLLLVPSLINHLKRWSQNRLWQTLLIFVDSLVSSLRGLPRHPVLAVIAIAESFYIWLCDALLLWLVIWSISDTAVTGLPAPFPFSSAGFVALTADIIAAAPLTPGGMGQVEASYAALLALLPTTFSVPAAILATRTISYWSFLIVSGIITFAAGFGGLLSRRASPLAPGTPTTPAADGQP